MSKYITTAFVDNSSVPYSGLIPTIRIRDLSDNSLIVTDSSMVEVGDGLYKYNFIEYNPTINYAIRCDAGVDISGRYNFGATDQDLEADITIIKSDIENSIYGLSALYSGIIEIPTNTLLVNDTRLNHLDSNISNTATQSSVNTIGIDVALIKKLESKRWKILNNQMIFYDDDNITPLLTFDLKDASGNPTMTTPYERVPV